MISIRVNGFVRDDVLLIAGGALEETSAHTTSSSVSIKVPIDTDDIQECDYLQIFDADTLVFAGVILKKNQQSFDTTDLSWRIYELELAGNSDLVATIFVDLVFPAGANIQQILLGNHEDDNWYDNDLGIFDGIYHARMAPEGISLGTVDDFTSFALNEPAYLWGRYVSDVLTELADIASAWWEITPGKVFNMRLNTSRDIFPVAIDDTSAIFSLNVTKDALTYYSACRVVGGVGTSRKLDVPAQGSYAARDPMSIWQKSETVLVSETPLRSVSSLQQTEGGQAPSDPTCPAIINVGYKGLHDDDPNYQALMTSGGTEIELKDGYKLVLLPPNTPYYQILVRDVVYEINVYARIVDPELSQQIASRRGGSGVVEYAIEDESIKDFGSAFNMAQTFLSMHAQPVAEISFSCFFKIPVDTLVTVNLPYYGVIGNYQVTKTVATTILDRTGLAVLQYDVTLSNAAYRDPYAELWFKPTVTTFALDSGQPAEDGLYISNTINVKTYITAYTSTVVTWDLIQQRASTWSRFEDVYPTWQMLQSASNPYPWAELEYRFTSWQMFENTVTTWAWLEQIQLEGYYLGNYLTAYGKKQLLSYLSGEAASAGTDLWGRISLVSSGGDTEQFTPESVSMSSNGGTAIYVVLPSDAQYQISKIVVPEKNLGNGTPILSADVDIDHRYYNARGQYTLTIAVQTTII